MRRNRPIVIAAAVTGSFVVGVVWLLAQRGSPSPIEVRAVGNMESTNFRTGMTFTGPTFWISNRTAKILHVSAWAIEIKDGASWTKRNYRDWTGGMVLGPRAVATQTIDFSSQLYPLPTNTWRLEVNVAEKLSRAEAFLVPIEHYPGWLLQRYRTGDTNLSRANPLKHFGATWYGHPRKVVSENVGEHGSPG
jgi:hypothetical protein